MKLGAIYTTKGGGNPMIQGPIFEKLEVCLSKLKLEELKRLG